MRTYRQNSLIAALRAAFAIGAALIGSAATAPAYGQDAASARACVATVARAPAAQAARLGLSTEAFASLRTNYRLSNEQACSLRAGDAKAMAKAQQTAPDLNYEALRFDTMVQRDNSGTVKKDGLELALAQRAQIIGTPKSKAGGISAPQWVPLGPTNVGGRVRSVLPHPTAAGRLLAGSVSGGVFKRATADGAWGPVNDFLPNMAITCLVQDPANPSQIYACTGEGAYNAATQSMAIDAVRGSGILRSFDGGDSWVRVPSTNPSTAVEDGAWNYVNKVAIKPLNPNIILAATHRGLFRSVDGGVSWTLAYGYLDDNTRRRVMDVKFDPANPNNAVLGESAHKDTTGAIVGGAIAVSSDSGATWTRMPLSGNDRVDVAVSGLVTGTWYASVNANGGEVWKITNLLGIWVPLKVATPGHLGTQGWYANAIWVSPDGLRVIVGGASLRMSVDAGLTFGDPIPGITGRTHTITADPNFLQNGIIYIGTDTGVYTASGVNLAAPNGVNVSAINNGLAITQFNGAAGRAAVSPRIVGGTQHTGSLVNNGSSWSAISGGDGGRVAIDPVDPNVFYASSPYLGIYRTLDGGLTFDYICGALADAACGNPSATPHANYIAPFSIDPNNANRMYAGGESLWRTENVKVGPPVWSAVKAPYANGTGVPSPISAIGLTPGNADIVWVGYNSGAIFRTTNATAAAPVWSPITFNGLDAMPMRMVTRIYVDDQNPNRVYVTFGGYSTGNVVRTWDGGTTWESAHGNLPAAPVRSIARHPTLTNLFYVGTEVGVFASENGGLVWSTSTEGPGTISAEEVFWFDSATLIAATHGRGVFKATIDTPASTGTIQFSRTIFNSFEGTTASIWVTRLGGASGAASVDYTTESGTASAGADFTATTGNLAWANGDSSIKTLSIPIASDGPEGLESFTVRLSNAQGALLGDPKTTTVRVLDQFPPAPEILAGWVTGAGATTGWSVTGDDPFEGSQGLRSNALGANEKAETTLTTLFNDGIIAFARKVSSRQGSHFLRFSIDGVVLGEWSGDVAWDVVSFPITAGVHTLKISYTKDGQPGVGSDTAWVDAITLPLVAPGRVQFTVPSTFVTEGQGSITLTVMRSLGSLGAATVNYATVAGSATAGSDFTAASGTLSFASGEMTKTIAINVVADALADSGETFTVALSSPVNVALGNWATATVTIYDPWPAAGTLPAGWATTSGANKGWVVATDSSYEGPQSLKSDTIADNQRADTEITALFAAGNVSFARRVSSESGDFLRFYVDGVLKGEWSGNVAWGVVSYPLATGTHTLRWSYQKNASLAAGSDAAWIDAVATPTILVSAADNDNDGMPNAVEIAEGRNPLAKDNDIFANARWFAMQQYRDFLGREGDAGGVDYYTANINSGAISRPQVIANFFNSPEFQGAGAPVVRLYFAFFNRIPDYGGLTFQVQQLRLGAPLAGIASNFSLSPEFIAKYGSLTNAQYVALLYQSVLGRTASQGEIDYHVARLVAGTTRGELMVGFSESPEYIASMTNKVYVVMMYVGMLRRSPDSGGFGYWATQLDAGVPGLALVNGFFASVEYRNRFLP